MEVIPKEAAGRAAKRVWDEATAWPLLSSHPVILPSEGRESINFPTLKKEKGEVG